MRTTDVPTVCLVCVANEGASLVSVLNINVATIRSAGAAFTAASEELLHTHREKYSHANQSAADGVPSCPSSSSSVAPSYHEFSFLNDAFVLPEGFLASANIMLLKDAYINREGGGKDDDACGFAGRAMTSVRPMLSDRLQLIYGAARARGRPVFRSGIEGHRRKRHTL